MKIDNISMVPPHKPRHLSNIQKNHSLSKNAPIFLKLHTLYFCNTQSEVEIYRSTFPDISPNIKIQKIYMLKNVRYVSDCFQCPCLIFSVLPISPKIQTFNHFLKTTPISVFLRIFHLVNPVFVAIIESSGTILPHFPPFLP